MLMFDLDNTLIKNPYDTKYGYSLETFLAMEKVLPTVPTVLGRFVRFMSKFTTIIIVTNRRRSEHGYRAANELGLKKFKIVFCAGQKGKFLRRLKRFWLLIDDQYPPIRRFL